MFDVIDLKTFVAQTLIQIVEGVQKAASELDDGEEVINPVLARQAAPSGMMPTIHGNFAQKIKFDVAITADESKTTKGGVGIFVGAFALGSSGQSGAQQQSMNRVQFSVPLAWPEHKKDIGTEA